jgi:hypothetical protein
MARPRAKSMINALGELHACWLEQERELRELRALVVRLREERDELQAQLQFVNAAATEETRTAGRLRAELLSRTSVPDERVDFCCDDEWGETTAVLPLPRGLRQRLRVRGDDTERVVRE